MSRYKYANTFDFKVTGRYAMFSDIVTSVGGERSTYMVPTYEAIKGLIQQLYWKPTLTYEIESVRVMKPIRTTCKGVRLVKYDAKYGHNSDISYYTYLCDVEYQVRAHFKWNENRPEYADDRDAAKHMSILKRAIERGGRRTPYLGTKECIAEIEPCVFGEGEGFYDGSGIVQLGNMYHGKTYPDEVEHVEDVDKLTVRFWDAKMENGVINFITPKECNKKRHVREMQMKKFERKEQGV